MFGDELNIKKIGFVMQIRIVNLLDKMNFLPLTERIDIIHKSSAKLIGFIRIQEKLSIHVHFTFFF